MNKIEQKSSNAYTVIQLTQKIKNILEKESQLSGIWLQGEVTNFVRTAVGHCYFSLKDEEAVIKATLWASNYRRLKVDIKNGSLIMVNGSVSLYPPRGEYQFVVQDARPIGAGALYEAYEKLKKKLLAEGLFDSARKLELPFIPKGVGVVAASKGAVIQDIYNVIRRRYVNMPIYLVPSKVQGVEAPAEIVAALKRLNYDDRVDVIIVARGGGSMEDLWAFNDERLARAIAASAKPIISAVGHESDVTISDYVADKRASTPSVAAELVVPVKNELKSAIKAQQNTMERLVKNLITIKRQRHAQLAENRFLNRPELIITEKRTRILNLTRELDGLYQQRYKTKQHVFSLLSSKLELLNPKNILSRGYLVAMDEQGKAIRSVNQMKEKQVLNLTLTDGEARVLIEEVKQEEESDR
jgi:exodeoxyribonuclease VII large subunit